MHTPSDTVIEHILGNETRVTRRAEIYEADGETVFAEMPTIRSGGVSVDQSRSERRMFDLVVDNEDRAFDVTPNNGLWYDKVVKLYRGIEWEEQDTYQQAVLSWGPRAYWSFDLGTGTTEPNQGATGGSTNDFGSGAVRAQGINGAGIKFDGTTNGYFNQNVAGFDFNLPWTLEFWARLDAVPSATGRIAHLGSVSSTADAYINISTTGRVLLNYTMTTGTASTTTQVGSGSTHLFMLPGMWKHIVATYDGANTTALYLDGVQVDIKTSANPMRTATGTLVRFGKAASSAFFPGRVDEPAIYQYAMTPEQVGLRYAQSMGSRPYTRATWESHLGEFVIDSLETPHFPYLISMSGRDYTKKLILSKFPQSTEFAQGQPIEEVIRTIAQNGGITKFILPVTGKGMNATHFFERGTPRWEAIEKIAQAYNYEVFFDAHGYLTMREYQDPTTSPLIWTFKTGSKGDLGSYRKRTSDARLYNHIVVTGEREGQPAIVAEALNNQPDSPTRIARIGDRVYEYVSSFFNTQAQAQDVADSMLAIHALEQFDLSLEAIVLPWLDVGNIIGFTDPRPVPTDPTRFLLSDFTIPLALEAMPLTGKRVTIVG